jgi:hypothetical protein
MGTVSSVIVADFNVVGVTIGQPKADAPLVVHRDRVLAMPICLEGMQVIAPRHLEVVEAGGEMHILEFTNRTSDQVGWKPLGPSGREEIMGAPIRERLDHIEV